MIHVYGLIIAVAVCLGFYYFQHHTSLPEKQLDNFFIELFFSCLFGARLYHIIDYWSYYQNHILQIPAIWHGGLGIFGALFGGFIFTYFYCKKHSILFSQLLQELATPLSLVQSIGRWGNFANHEVYGSRGEPIWLYESAICFLLFLFLNLQKKNQLAYYLFFYGLARFCLEFLRTDTWQIGGLKIAQGISLVFIITGLYLFFLTKTKSNPEA